MITYHPADELLLTYAAGTADEGTSLVLATHLALCPVCRKTVAEAEAAGGVLLESTPPSALSANAAQSVMSRLDAATPLPRSLKPNFSGTTRVPEPLRSYIGPDFDAVEWKKITSGLSFKPLHQQGPVRAVLIRSKAGSGVYEHTHRGEELTLVLTGGFTDPSGHYQRGDFQGTSPEIHHALVADEGEDCIVLAMTNAPVKFRNPVVGLLAKLFGF